MDLKLPMLGWSSAVPAPCNECLRSVAKMNSASSMAGQQSDCWECHNRLTVVDLSKQDASIHDALSYLGPEQTTEYVLTGAQFERSAGFGQDSAQAWLVERSIDGLAAPESQPHYEWFGFEKEHSGAPVFAPLAPGVLGRFALSSTPL